MIGIYQYVEFILLTLFITRLLYIRRKQLKFDGKFIDVLLFYFIWYTHSILTWIIPNTTFTFYFVHCTFPILLSGALLFKSWPFKYFIPLSLSLIILYYRNHYFIDLSYIIVYIIILFRINQLYYLNRKNRDKISIYGAMLSVLIMTHLLFMFGYVNVDWSESIFIKHFLYLVIIIYLSSLILIHAQFRRFLTH
jgi:hypothetical protein